MRHFYYIKIYYFKYIYYIENLVDIGKSIEEIHAKLRGNDFNFEVTSSELKGDLE